MDVITLNATPREAGKKAAKAVRRSGQVPCVLYGHNIEPVAFQVPVLSLNPLIYTDETHRVEVNIDGEKWTCIVKDIDFDPVTDQPIHVDFQVLRAGEKVHISVPVQFHGKAVGQERGGEVDFVLHTIEVECLPKDIPAHLDVDITRLDIGDSIHISDLSVPGITFLANPSQTVVTVLGGKRHLEEAEEQAAEGTEL